MTNAFQSPRFIRGLPPLPGDLRLLRGPLRTNWQIAPTVALGVFALAAGYILTRPVVAFVLSSLVVILWHLPALYEASLRSEPVHVVQHQLFLITALLVWWPLLGSLPERPRPSPLGQCLLLFALTFPGAIIGSFLTLGEFGFDPYYTTVPRMWGLDLATDQQIAGLAMWVGGSVIYLLLITEAGDMQVARRK